jgi:hypothetical protein
MVYPPLTLRQLVTAVGCVLPGEVHDVAQTAHLYEYSAQIRGLLILNRNHMVTEPRPLAFRLTQADTASALAALERAGVDLDLVLPQGTVTDDEMREVYRASRPPPPISPAGATADARPPPIRTTK